MTPLVENNLLVLAILLLIVGIVAGATGLIAKLIAWNEQRLRRKRARFYPNRWPRTDYRVGSVYRQQDTH